MAEWRGDEPRASYDALDRLTGVTGFGATAFTYDAQGNRTTKGSGSPQVSYSYSSTTNRLTSATTTLGAPEAGTFLYDSAGNMTADGTGTYAYSSRNMMQASTISGAITRYQYNAAGQRAVKSGPSGQALFIHGLGSLLLAEYASSFSKESPLAATTGLSPDVTLEWSAVPSATYEVCIDVTNDDACDGSWVSLTSARSTIIDDLGAGTYFWQVRATTTGGTTYADANNWWSFTVVREGAYGKIAPQHLSRVLTADFTVSWQALPGDVGYWVCWDTSNNNTCDSGWYPNGAATTKLLEGLGAGTYYWQVKDSEVSLEADAGVWWSFTIVSGTTGKLAPLNWATGFGANLWLAWSAVADAGYWTCVDTTNNNSCDGDNWYPNGAMTTKLIEGLSAGTYYWQVKIDPDAGADYEANGGTWWSFTVGAGSASGTGTASVAREYIYLGSRLLVSVESGTTTTYYHADILGSVRAITSSSGSTVTRHDFFPFGESTSSLTGDPRRFLGQELDAETGFDHFGARQYRNVWGRFTSPDPIFSEGAMTNPQLWNRYAYSLNGPLRYSDPSGLAPQEDEPEMAEYGGANCTWSCEDFDDYVNFFFNGSVSQSYSTWVAAGRQSVAAEEQADKEAEARRQIWQSPAFALLSAILWAQSDGGKTVWEPTAFIFQRAGVFSFRIQTPTYEAGRWTGARPGLGGFAVIHVHRNSEGPSTVLNYDNVSARENRLDIYVISQYGLGRHLPDGSFDGRLRTDTAWMNGALRMLLPVRVR